MIRKLVDFSLNNRFIVLSLALLLFIWGTIAFKKLPVEAYPDVANTWVQVITQWPGRAAEEVEQQVATCALRFIGWVVRGQSDLR
jgi:heavy metal efflux system protein